MAKSTTSHSRKALTRQWEQRGIAHKIAALRDEGWNKWEAANLSGWDDLGIDPLAPATDIDLSTDWSVYVINRLAAQQVVPLLRQDCKSPFSSGDHGDVQRAASQIEYQPVLVPCLWFDSICDGGRNRLLEQVCLRNSS